MSHMRGFSVQDLKVTPKNELVTEVITNLQVTEEQAIRLVRIFKNHHYLTIDALVEQLKEEQLPPVSLQLVAAFLAGYLAGETYDSRFDVSLFGSMSITDGKDQCVAASLHALINLINETGIGDLPNRLSDDQTLAGAIAQTDETRGKQESIDSDFDPELNDVN